MASVPGGTGSFSPRVRTVVAVVFLTVWLALVIYDALSDAWAMPAWLQGVGVVVLGYVVGVPIARLASPWVALGGNAKQDERTEKESR